MYALYGNHDIVKRMVSLLNEPFYSGVILQDYRRKLQNNCMLITGHTHRPTIGTKESPYCNIGSCVSPGGVTCIEIQNRCLTLVKWSMKAREDFTLYAAHEVLGETVCLDDY